MTIKNNKKRNYVYDTKGYRVIEGLTSKYKLKVKMEGSSLSLEIFKNEPFYLISFLNNDLKYREMKFKDVKKCIDTIKKFVDWQVEINGFHSTKLQKFRI